MDLLFGLRDRHGATLVLVTHAPDLAGAATGWCGCATGASTADDPAREAAE
jgi:putative ABC transport system ATP-binding protein